MAGINGTRTHRLLAAISLLAGVGVGAAQAQPVLPSGPEIAVNLGSPGDLFAPMPQAAVFPDGGFVVAWTVGDPRGQTVIHARMFARDGAPSSSENSLLHPFNQRVDSLAVTAGGGFWMGWEQLDRRGRSSVLVRRFDAHGLPLGVPRVVHAPSAFNRQYARLAAAPDDGVVVAWAADRDGPNGPRFGTDIVVRFFGPDSTPRSGELLVGGGVPDYPAAVGVEPDGSAWVVGLQAVRAFHVTPEGPVGSRLDVCQGSPICAPFTYLASPALAMRPDGSFVVVWIGWVSGPDRFSKVIVGRLFADDGTPLGAAFQVNKRLADEIDPLVAALPDGRFVAAWSDDSSTGHAPPNVYGRSFAADGTPTSRDFRVHFGDQGLLLSSLAAGRAGNVVAVWEQSTGLAGLQVLARQLETP